MTLFAVVIRAAALAGAVYYIIGASHLVAMLATFPRP